MPVAVDKHLVKMRSVSGGVKFFGLKNSDCFSMQLPFRFPPLGTGKRGPQFFLKLGAAGFRKDDRSSNSII